MKNIIQQLFSSKSTKKTNRLTAWVDDLDDMDDLAALQFAAKHLGHLLTQADEQETLNLQQQLDLIVELESRNQSRLEKLSSQFSNVENMKTELENSICDTCYNYCRQSYIYHLKFIEKVFDSNKSKLENNFKLDGNMPAFIIARALNLAFSMVKWRLFSQSSPPAKMWLQVNVLYRIAAQQMLLNIPIELFDLAPSTTLSAYFVQTWMLGQLVQSSMHKHQVEIATHIINTLLTRVHISDVLTPEQYVFYIDLQVDNPAKRMRNFEPGDSCRYWELDELERQLTIAITVSDRGEIPQSLAFSKIDHPKKLNDTLKILLDEWKKTGYVRQRRKTPRQASSKTARVSAGIADICNQVNQANQIGKGLCLSRDSTSLDERIRAHTVLRQTSTISHNSGSLDTWIITDESPPGLGTRVNKYANILARPDKLIGLVVDGEPGKVIIGMIRSVKPTHGNQLRVGIAIISKLPDWVQLRQLRGQEAFANTEVHIEPLRGVNVKKTSATVDIGVFSGIYLPVEAGLSETPMLILPKINYRADVTYSVNIAGSTKNVLLGTPVESRDDWVRVDFPF